MGQGRRQCTQDGLNKGAWTDNEDKILADYIKVYGEGKWSNVAKNTGLKRCGKSCRLRWRNYLKPGIKRGHISDDEEDLIIRLHKLLGNRWSLIAGRLPGRTDNEIKNYWNSTLSKRAKLMAPNIDNVDEGPQTMSTTHKITVDGVLVDTAAQLAQNQHSTDHVSSILESSSETNVPLKLEFEFKDELPSSTLPKLQADDDPTDFLLDLNVEDIRMFLDTDHMSIDDEVRLNGRGDNGDGGSSFLKKSAEMDMPCSSLDFQSLAASFIESAEEWPGII